VYSDPVYGWYEYDLNTLVNGWADGDLITVEATAPGWSGANQGIVTSAQPILDLNVVLYPGVMTFTITLTVTDVLGQTDMMSLDVQISQ